MKYLKMIATMVAITISFVVNAQSLKEFTVGEKVQNLTAKEKSLGQREMMTTLGKIRGTLLVNILNDGRVAMAIFQPNADGDGQIDRLFKYQLDELINGVSKKNKVELIPITAEGGDRPYLYVSEDMDLYIKAAYDDFGDDDLVPKYRVIVVIGNNDLQEKWLEERNKVAY